MVSSPTTQVLSTAVDTPGLSVCTANRDPADPRPGAAYDNTVMAAALPIHFHPMTAPGLGGANFMMLSAARWHDATPLATDPGFFNPYTVDDLPSWLLVNAANGHTKAVNLGVELPMSTAVSARTLTGAVSRGTDMLYTLAAVTIDTVAAAVIQHWHNNTAINTLNAIGEETLPVATNGSDTIIFSAGLHYSKATDPYLYVYGTGSTTHALYVARKNWGRVGQLGIATQKMDGQWEVMTADGWSTDPTAAKPMQDGLLSYGPVSVANHALPRSVIGSTANYTFLATTQKSGSTMTAQIYASLSGRAWKPLGAPIALGTLGTTYLGATAQLQPQLGANPALVDTTSAAAVPYVVGVKNSTGGADQIEITWDLLQVPQVS